MSNAAALLDLPPTAPAYVETYQLAAVSCEDIRMLGSAEYRRMPPAEPPHEHEHADKPPREPIRVNVSDRLNLRESLTGELIPRG